MVHRPPAWASNVGPQSPPILHLNKLSGSSGSCESWRLLSAKDCGKEEHNSVRRRHLGKCGIQMYPAELIMLFREVAAWAQRLEEIRGQLREGQAQSRPFYESHWWLVLPACVSQEGQGDPAGMLTSIPDLPCPRTKLSCCCCLVIQSCPTLSDPMPCSTPGFPVFHYFPEFAQTHVHWIGDAIQPSHPLSSPSLPAFNLSQHQCLSPVIWFFALGSQRIGTSASATVLPMNIQGWFPLGWTGLISLQSKGVSRVFSNTTVQNHRFFSTQTSLWSNSHIHTWLLEKP